MRGATIVYATHIFDGLHPWLTHLAFISQGCLLKGTPRLCTHHNLPCTHHNLPFLAHITSCLTHITSCLFCTTSCLLDITSCLFAWVLQLTLGSAVHKATVVQRRHSEQQPSRLYLDICCQSLPEALIALFAHSRPLFIDISVAVALTASDIAFLPSTVSGIFHASLTCLPHIYNAVARLAL